MSRNQINQTNTDQLDNSMGDYQSSWITDYAWISGLTGAIAVIAIAAWYNLAQVFSKGLIIFGHQITNERNESNLLALLMITAIMVGVESIRIWYRDKPEFFNIHPKLRSTQHLSFLVECVTHYLLYLLLIWLVVWFYHSAGEYGYKRNAAYYQAWFRFIDWLLNAWLYAGLPYVLITRACRYHKNADTRDYALFLQRVLMYPFGKVFGFATRPTLLSDTDKKILRGLLVKMFFTPLMTVFFIGQFPHLVNNLGYLVDGLPKAILSGSYTNSKLNNDLFNISISFIFSIDVALAWCGYAISSRWVDNQTISAEPTMLGWVVCLLCYPPFQQYLGFYYGAPGEKEAIYMFHQQWLITILLVFMVASYTVYMLSTLWFGTRFSNLTHRGIIRKGPYSFVRHPAYASKNFAWWCIMFPAVLYNAVHNRIEPAILQILGLILLTWTYYWRAITEERHLGADPAYQDYCQHVRYRFLPRIL